MMPLLVLLAVVALIVVLSVLVWRHRRRTLTGVQVGSFAPRRGMEIRGVGMPRGAKITRARCTGEDRFDLSVGKGKEARFTGGSWAPADPRWAYHQPRVEPDSSSVAAMTTEQLDAEEIERLYRQVFRKEGAHGARVAFTPKDGQPVTFVNNYGRWERVARR